MTGIIKKRNDLIQARFVDGDDTPLIGYHNVWTGFV